jgi:Spy/CpxP family protein refolding chaperone
LASSVQKGRVRFSAQNYEISCQKLCLTIPLAWAMASGVVHVDTTYFRGGLSMRFILVSAVASTLVLGVGPLAMADELTNIGSEMKQDMGSMANEAKGDMASEHEQMKENFKAKKDQMKDEMKAKREQMKSEMKAKRDALKAERQEMKNAAKAKKGKAQRKAKEAVESTTSRPY